MTTRIHIYAPQATAKAVHAGTCLDCGRRTRFLQFFTPWHGWDVTCLRCGRQWQDSEWMPLDFVRQSRQKSVAAAKDRWHAMPPVEENYYA